MTEIHPVDLTDHTGISQDFTFTCRDCGGPVEVVQGTEQTHDCRVAPLVFLDCETTSLSLDDDIWEFAAIRRGPDGTESELHLFIEHDAGKCALLPESFRADHRARFSDQAVGRREAAALIAHFLEPETDFRRVHLVGAVPSFDAERLALLLRRSGWSPSWHHRLICVESLSAGHLGWYPGGLSRCAEALGIEHPAAHTAMGDARTALAIWDKVIR